MDVDPAIIEAIKRRYETTPCRMCSEPIVFKKGTGKKMQPYNPDGTTPHWETCSYSPLVQKRTAHVILRKILSYLVMRHGDKFVEAGLDPYESKIAAAILTKELPKPAPPAKA